MKSRHFSSSTRILQNQYVYTRNITIIDRKSFHEFVEAADDDVRLQRAVSLTRRPIVNGLGISLIYVSKISYEMESTGQRLGHVVLKLLRVNVITITATTTTR